MKHNTNIQPIKCIIIENEAETPAGGGAKW